MEFVQHDPDVVDVTAILWASTIAILVLAGAVGLAPAFNGARMSASAAQHCKVFVMIGPFAVRGRGVLCRLGALWSIPYNGMLELLTWFAGKPENRRRYPRRAGGFRVWFATESGWTNAGGIDISASGMGLIAPAKFAKDEVNLRIVIENKAILARAKQVWCIPGTLQGKPVYRYGMQYTGIGADDWDALVRFCNSEAVVIENKAQKELEMVRLQADDVARLIPTRLQDRLLTMLVQARRLAPLDKEKTPLVQYAYGGVLKRAGKQLHRLQIHSRVHDELTGETIAHDTRFLFDDSGTDIEMDAR